MLAARLRAAHAAARLSALFVVLHPLHFGAGNSMAQRSESSLRSAYVLRFSSAAASGFVPNTSAELQLALRCTLFITTAPRRSLLSNSLIRSRTRLRSMASASQAHLFLLVSFSSTLFSFSKLSTTSSTSFESRREDGLTAASSIWSHLAGHAISSIARRISAASRCTPRGNVYAGVANALDALKAASSLPLGSTETFLSCMSRAALRHYVDRRAEATCCYRFGRDGVALHSASAGWHRSAILRGGDAAFIDRALDGGTGYSPVRGVLLLAHQRYGILRSAARRGIRKTAPPGWWRS